MKLKLKIKSEKTISENNLVKEFKPITGELGPGERMERPNPPILIGQAVDLLHNGHVLEALAHYRDNMDLYHRTMTAMNELLKIKQELHDLEGK